MMIFGIPDKAPTMLDIYSNNAAAWVGTGAIILKFEDLLEQVKNIQDKPAESFFTDLFGKLGMGALPEDWRERVRIGADREQSGTARENLAGAGGDIPDELPEKQKQLVEFAAPGLRTLLGYS
jgi:hypothetical protein